MKTSIISLLFLQTLLLSCHQKAAVTHLSCCTKDKSVAMQPLLATPITNTSIYQLPGEWTDQHNRPFALGELKGKIQLVAMVFTHCGYACPRIVADMKTIADAVPATEKNQVGFTLVSFDPERDTPQQLSRFAAQQQLDQHWTLLRGDADLVRELSLLLNIRYQKLPNGDFNHSNSIFVLDQQGTVVRSFEGLGSHTEIAGQAINQLVSRPTTF
jgi:protein SCO1